MDSMIEENKIEVMCKYGSGQFGRVMKCKYQGETVAIKTLKSEFLGTVDEVSFFNELKLMKQLRHPNIIGYVGTGYKNIQGEKRLFVVEESVEGGSLYSILLRQVISFGRQLYSITDAYNWIVDIAKGMQYLHNQTPMVIHRDLKLQNVMLDRKQDRPRAVIIDFGVHTIVNNTNVKMDTYNLTGQTGTYIYMAPEVFLQKPYNEKVDVFSYGVMVWELFARSLISISVAPSGTSKEIMKYAQQQSTGQRQTIPQSWPNKLQKLIRLCWNQSPCERPSFNRIITMLIEMEEDIVAWEQQQPVKQCCCNIM